MFWTFYISKNSYIVFFSALEMFTYPCTILERAISRRYVNPLSLLNHRAFTECFKYNSIIRIAVKPSYPSVVDLKMILAFSVLRLLAPYCIKD